jgi:methylthioribose-1-phosphate isomerase
MTIECHDAAAATAAIRSGVVTPGPVLAEVGAYAMVLAVADAADHSPASREQRVRAAAGALRVARRDVHVLGRAVDVAEARYDELSAAGALAHELVAGVTDAADAVALGAQAAHATIARRLSEWLAASAPSDVGASISVLMHGDGGPLSSGMVGPVTAAFQALAQRGVALHVWVTDAGPSAEGTRVTARTLSELDIPHTVIPDTAVGWLVANRPLSAALLRGDTVFRGGDIAALIGSLNVAAIAAGGGVPVIALAPLAAHDESEHDSRSVVMALRSAAESGAARQARLDPAVDIVPGRLVTHVISEGASPS